jgi:hypothetical protein
MFSDEAIARWTVLRDGRGHEVLALLAGVVEDLRGVDIRAVGLPSKESSTSQFNGYVDYSAALYVEKLRELFAVVVDCVERERYLGMVTCLRSIVEHAGVLHEFLLKPSPRIFSETFNDGNADTTAYDPAMADFDKFLRGNAFPWDELGSADVEDLGPRAVEGSPRPVKVGRVALPALYDHFPVAKVLYNMLSDMVHPNAGGHMLMLREQGGQAVVGAAGDTSATIDLAARPLIFTCALYEQVVAKDLRTLIGLRLVKPPQEPAKSMH